MLPGDPWEGNCLFLNRLNKKPGYKQSKDYLHFPGNPWEGKSFLLNGLNKKPGFHIFPATRGKVNRKIQ